MNSLTPRRRIAGLPLLALAAATCLMPVHSAAQEREQAAEVQIEPSTVTGWNFPVYDIPADPAVRFGTLDNGLKYAIMRNATPQNEVVLRMRYDVGFIDELDGELNAAHFIEHMAFNGSTNVPEGEMIKLLEREGLKFGADTNASTGFDETIYKLALPRNDERLIDTGLMLMREIGSELTITQGAVDRERGILQSEIQTRNSYQARNARTSFELLAPDTLYATRYPGPDGAGPTATVTAEQLRAMYERYYRPDNATLVIVGDVDPDMIEAKIQERFADWQKPEEPLFVTDVGMINFERAPAATNFVDPAIDYIVEITRQSPYVERPTTVAEARRAFQIGVASQVINRRLRKLALSPESPVLRAGMRIADFQDVAVHAGVTVYAREDRWDEALAAGEQEIRRALEYGFTASEITEALTNLDTALKNGAERQATRPSATLANSLITTLSDERPFVTPATRYDVFQQIRPELTAEAVHATFRQAFTGSGPLILVASKAPVEGGKDAILEAYEAAQEVAVTAPVEEATSDFAYTDFGTPGTVVADERIEDLGFRALTFDNNVRLNLKPTDFKDNEVRFHVRIGAGELGYGLDQPGATMMLNSVYGLAGLEQHGFEELRRILAGRNVSLGIASATDHFHAAGTTKAADFERQMEVTAAYLTAPGYRPEAGARWNAIIPPFIAQTDASPINVFRNEVRRVIAGGDKRFGTLDEQELLGLTLNDLRAAVAPGLEQGAIEIAVVGDFEEQQVIDAAARTFGALPERPEALRDYPDARQVSFPEDRSLRTLYHKGEADQGLVHVAWPTDDDDNHKEEITGQLAAAIISLRLTEKLREELGATYSPEAYSSMSSVFDGFGYLGALAIVEPSKQALAFDAIDEIAAEMRDTAVDDDLLARARNPLVERIAKRRRENSYWVGALESAQLRADRLDRIRRYEPLLREITAADIQAFAQRYLAAEGVLRIAVVPEGSGE
ncbi:M16 family metallopeptidase [Qipengyuania sp. 902]|uniref:M16 family metallopeptidase n=1 Tax=Qipengyuania sp. 902 TaxID=3417565 RepID=UPI003EB8A3F7